MGEDYALQLNRDAQVNVLETRAAAARRRAPASCSSRATRRTSSAPPRRCPSTCRSRCRKRAGEDALRELHPGARGRGIGFVVVSGDMIEGTITATLLERANPGAIGARDARRPASSTTWASSPPRWPRPRSTRSRPTTPATSATTSFVRGGVRCAPPTSRSSSRSAGPTIAPDASSPLLDVRPDLAANARAVGQLWRVDLPDGSPRRLTRGTATRARGCRPDGSRIAFLRGDAQGHAAAARRGRRRGRARAGSPTPRSAWRSSTGRATAHDSPSPHASPSRAATAPSRGWMPPPSPPGASRACGACERPRLHRGSARAALRRGRTRSRRASRSTSRRPVARRRSRPSTSCAESVQLTDGDVDHSDAALRRRPHRCARRAPRGARPRPRDQLLGRPDRGRLRAVLLTDATARSRSLDLRRRPRRHGVPHRARRRSERHRLRRPRRRPVPARRHRRDPRSPIRDTIDLGDVGTHIAFAERRPRAGPHARRPGSCSRCDGRAA